MLQKKQDQDDNTRDHRDVQRRTPAKIKGNFSENLQMYPLMKAHNATSRENIRNEGEKGDNSSLLHSIITEARELPHLICYHNVESPPNEELVIYLSTEAASISFLNPFYQTKDPSQGRLEEVGAGETAKESK